MTWFKVDDGLHSHRKVRSLPRKDRMPALGLWCLAGSWCADNLTDGHVPTYMLEELGGTLRQAQLLVTSGLWVQVDDGFQFHGWSDEGRQPTRAEVEAHRESERKRKARWRASVDTSHRDKAGTDGGTDGGTPASVPPGVRTPRPDPSRPVLSSGLGSQSLQARSADRTSDRPDLDKIAKTLGADQRWAERVARQVLDRAPADVRDPTAYVVRAIRERPDDYRPTPQPPRKEDRCHEHGRDRATCPASWHEEAS